MLPIALINELKERMIPSPVCSPTRKSVRQRFFARRSGALLLLVAACLATFAGLPVTHAQTNFDRPGGDYMSSPIESGDPADCALMCERDKRCRAWSFNYPTYSDTGAV